MSDLTKCLLHFFKLGDFDGFPALWSGIPQSPLHTYTRYEAGSFFSFRWTPLKCFNEKKLDVRYRDLLHRQPLCGCIYFVKWEKLVLQSGPPLSSQGWASCEIQPDSAPHAAGGRSVLFPLDPSREVIFFSHSYKSHGMCLQQPWRGYF